MNDCPICNGQPELNALGGIHCFFCGYDSGNRMPAMETASARAPVIMDVYPAVQKDGKTFYKIDGKLVPLIDNLPTALT